MTDTRNHKGTDYLRKVRLLLHRIKPGASWTNRLAVMLIFAAIIAGSATYGALNATPPFGNDPHTVIWMLNIDLIILLLFVALIARRVASIWSGHRRGVAGSRLHVRLVSAFSIMAVTPAVIMTIFAAFFLHFGVQSWFSDRIKTAIDESQAVATAYLEEHLEVIRADVMAMANDLDRQASLFIANAEAFDKIIQTQSMLRNLSESMVFDSDGHVLAKSSLSYALSFDDLSPYHLSRAKEGEVVLITPDSEDRVRALVRLGNFSDAYLFVGRTVDPVVLSHLADTKKATEEYETLEAQRSSLQVKITLIFVVVAFLLLLAAIWFGFLFARKLVQPIGELIEAADRIRAGDMTTRVAELDSKDEFDVLARAFNRMTRQIQEQRDELITANQQLDRRRHFTETVLAGVSSGVVGIDADGFITLANNSAAELFKHPTSDFVGKNIGDILPEIKNLLSQAKQKPGKISQGEIPYTITEEGRRILLARIVIDSDISGGVLTFDDITELQSAQRKAAWADVARRIAHEIKNPLTPIQLSAERLQRKYISQIIEEQDIFTQCTKTIIHHVGDIGRMVDEFSAFARMPDPVMKPEFPTRHILDLMAFQQQAHPEIIFDVSGIDPRQKDISALMDSQQIRQAFTNILQNAIDSIYLRKEESPAHKGQIRLSLMQRSEDIVITLADNGLGLPKTIDAIRLTEPYVTQKEKGTGLGLAIVKKIMEDHGGRVILGVPDWLKVSDHRNDLGGATVSLVLPVEKMINVFNNEHKMAV